MGWYIADTCRVHVGECKTAILEASYGLLFFNMDLNN